jgi:hypothetical protein
VVRVVGPASIGRGLGGVLGQVASDLSAVQDLGGVVGAAVGPQRAGVDLAAEREPPGRVGGVNAGHTPPDRGGGPADQQRQPGRLEAAGGACEHLGVRGRRGGTSAWKCSSPRCWYSATMAYWTVATSPSRTAGYPERVRDQPAQGDAEPSPQVRCPPLPHHVRVVVVAVAAQRLSPHRVVFAVPPVAGPRPTMDASATWRRFGHRVTAVVGVAAPGHRTERRPGHGREHQRVVGHRVRDALPPVRPARIRWNMSPVVRSNHAATDHRHNLRRRAEHTFDSLIC